MFGNDQHETEPQSSCVLLLLHTTTRGISPGKPSINEPIFLLGRIHLVDSPCELETKLP